MSESKIDRIAAVDFSTAVIFTPETRAAFATRLDGVIQLRRSHVYPNDKLEMIDWMTRPERKAKSRQELNRRSWLRRYFVYDAQKGRLLYAGKDHKERRRKVITTNKIPSIVEREHRASHIRGENDTWFRTKKKYYGITQPDVEYLLARCEVCRSRPRDGGFVEGLRRRQSNNISDEAGED
jgi:hypothetical protein